MLRRLVAHGHLTEPQGAIALAGFIDLELTRFPAAGLRPRMWELRHNLTGYDATYVALAEQLQVTSLLTTDARLAQAPGIACAVEVL